LVKGVYLTQLPSGPLSIANFRITDRYGVDSRQLFRSVSRPGELGWDGYMELDTGRPCAPGYPNVLWGAYTGIYDDRCLADPACDSRRLQTYVGPPAGGVQLVAYNYLIGPVTFSLDLTASAAPTAVRLDIGHIGGNGGNPAQRSATLPDETFVIQLP
jgi:hypothetical protein